MLTLFKKKYLTSPIPLWREYSGGGREGLSSHGLCRYVKASWIPFIWNIRHRLSFPSLCDQTWSAWSTVRKNTYNMPEKIQVQYLNYQRKSKWIYPPTFIDCNESAVEWNQKKKYYGILLDSTPDLRHRKQICWCGFSN